MPCRNETEEAMGIGSINYPEMPVEAMKKPGIRKCYYLYNEIIKERRK